MSDPVVNAGSLLQLLLSLGLVLGAIFALAWAARRMHQFRGTAGALRVCGGIPVGPKERVVVLRAGDTCLLLGVAPGSVRTLHTFDTVPDWLEEAGSADPAPFAQRLGEMMRTTRSRQ